MNHSVRVAVIDDSPFVRRLLASYIESVPDLRVVGTAGDGASGLALVNEAHPDVVTLDLEMPGEPGLAVLDRIMRETPTPVLIVSGVSRQAAARTVQALDRGAVDFILKYTPGRDTDPEELRSEIVAKVRAAAHVKVIRSLGSSGTIVRPGPLRRATSATPMSLAGGKLVVIGASTGGPAALRILLSSLTEEFDASMLVVQHLPAPFTEALAAQLTRQTRWPCKETAPGDALQPGLVYVARGDRHLLVRRNGSLELGDGPKVSGFRPSIDVTMRSAAESFGEWVRGVLLTGMGMDGAAGLEAIRSRGGRTYAQDESSCVVDSMPSKAVARGAVDHVGSPAEIARLLSREENERGQSAPVVRSASSDPLPVRR